MKLFQKPIMQLFDFSGGGDVGLEFTTGGNCVIEFMDESTHVKLTVPRDILIDIAIENLRMLQAEED